jgi:hypothetical protein
MKILGRPLSFFIVPGLFLLVILLFFSDRSRFQFDNDEGVFLMQGMLFERGYALYDPVWMDQTPLLPALLAAGFRIAGYKVGLARLLIAGFSSLLIGGVFHFLRRGPGLWAAVAGTVILFFSPLYLVLSVSVMNGLPAIALAVLSLVALDRWHRSEDPAALALSGFLMALSVSIKLFTAFLIPLYCAGLLVAAWSRAAGRPDWKTLARPVGLWAAGFLVPAIVVLAVLVRPGNLDNLLFVHLDVLDSSTLAGEKFQIWLYLKRLPVLLGLAGIGVFIAVRKKDWRMLYPASWIVLAIGFLGAITPVWDHHQLLITVPASMLAAYAAAEAAEWAAGRAGSPSRLNLAPVFRGTTIAVCVLLIFAQGRPDALDHLAFFPDPNRDDLQILNARVRILAEMQAYAPQTDWIFTDNLMMAFRARILVPPEIATFSRKRMEAGYLTEADLIAVLERYRPEQVFLDRFEYALLPEFLQADYELIGWKEGEYAWYLRSDLE